MFELLTRKNRIRYSLNENIVPPSVIEEETTQDIRYQIENFTKNIEFHGTSIMEFSFKLFSQFANDKEISQGAFFITELKDEKPVLKFLSAYASPNPLNNDDILEFGEGFPGQVAKDGKLINISNIPVGYFTIESGLGKASPVSLIIFPVKFNDTILAVIELASFHKFTTEDEFFFDEISPVIAEQIIKCNKKL